MIYDSCRYPCAVPDITFGIPLRSNGDVKMLLNNTVPCDKNSRLFGAISYLNKKRHNLRKPLDYHMHELKSLLERSDKDKTGYLSLIRIMELLAHFHIRLDFEKIRVALSHFQMIRDEGCATERVNYVDFFRLLSINEPLPKTGSMSNVSDSCSMETTYRLLCDDRNKKRKNDPIVINQKFKEDKTCVKDLVTPDISILRGLNSSDFSRLRPKVEIERIFRSLLPRDKFEAIWQNLMIEHRDQNDMVSVIQFRTEMHNKIETA